MQSKRENPLCKDKKSEVSEWFVAIGSLPPSGQECELQPVKWHLAFELFHQIVKKKMVTTTSDLYLCSGWLV